MLDRETPPPPVTLNDQRRDQLDPTGILPDLHTGYPYYHHISANSQRLHNQWIRHLSLHMQHSGAHFVLGGMNTFKVYERLKYLSVIGQHRPSNQSLITVGNHQSTLDDPAILGSVTPSSIMTSPSQARWSWCAREICFPNRFTGWFFLHGKVFPIVRGLGLFQQGMREAEEHILRGEHINIFPEGKCIPVESGIAPLRWGTAKLVADALRRTRRCEEMKREWNINEQHIKSINDNNNTRLKADSTTPPASSSPSPSLAAPPASSPSPSLSSPSSPPVPFDPLSYGSLVPPFPGSPFSSPCPLPPIVLPYVHHGMPKVMPFYHRIPKSGHTVRCIFGDPITFDDLIQFHEDNQHNRLAFDYPAEEDLLISMTNRIYDRMVELDRRLIEIERKEKEEDAQTTPTQQQLITS